jgi:hypothetical protein
MYIMIVSDAPALPVDICIASAMLGHAAWAFRPEELGSLRSNRPSLVLLDLGRSADIATSAAQVRASFSDVAIAVLGSPNGTHGPFLSLSRPVTAEGLREVVRQATAVAA